MIPLYDENPTYERPLVNYALIIANALVFVLLVFIEYGFGRYELAKFYYDWAVVPYYITNNSHLYTLVTSMFMHGGFLHFGGNMLYLYIFGNNIEDSMGHGRYLVFYLICGFSASLAQILVEPSSTIPMLGASGAIAGVLGAYLVTFPRAKVVTLAIYFVMRIPAVIVLGFWFLLQLFSGVGSIASGADGGVAYFAHIGGFAAGMILVLLFRKRNFKARQKKREDWEKIYYQY